MSSQAKSSFFKQSGWMVIATFTGGIFMVSVQMAAQNVHVMAKGDFNTFIALLRLLIIFGGVPSAALQSIFAQQSAAAVTDEKAGEVTASVRAVGTATFFFWLVLTGLMVIFAKPVSQALGINDPLALCIAMPAVLSAIYVPMVRGVLQGLHRFGPLGWLMILEGTLRVGVFAVLVIGLHWRAVGGMWAVVLAQYTTLVISLFMTRDVWAAKTTAVFSWKKWLMRGAPLTMGMGSIILMYNLDSLFAKSLFLDQAAIRFYNCAMLIGYAIVQFIAPIAVVMFPTIVRNLALSKKTDALLLTVGVTGGFALLAAVGCTLFPKLPLAILHFPLDAAPLVKWFAWSLLPLTLANVLIQNLLARGRFAAAQWLILVPVLYALTLMAISPVLIRLPIFTAFERVIQTLGSFCLLFFCVAAWFTWRKETSGAAGPGLAGGRSVSDTATSRLDGKVSSDR